MLTPRRDAPTRFGRQDAGRLAIAFGILALALTVILGIDILSQQPLTLTAGQLSTRDIIAPRAIDFESKVETDAARAAASAAVDVQYTYTADNASLIAANQQLAFETRVNRDRHGLQGGHHGGGAGEPARDRGPEPVGRGPGDARRSRRRPAGRRSGPRPPGSSTRTLRTEVRDTLVTEVRARLAGNMAGGLDEPEAGARGRAHRPARRSPTRRSATS